MKPVEGRKRVIIEEVQPRVDCGRFPAKRTIGDVVTVTAAVFADGHDHVAGRLLYRHDKDRHWRFAQLHFVNNDIWSASFTVDRIGTWHYTVEAWVDHFGTWCADLKKRLDAQHDPTADPVAASQNIPLALRIGADHLQHTLARVKGPDATLLNQILVSLRWLADQKTDLTDHPLCDEIITLVNQYPDPSLTTRYPQDLSLWVDRERARFSTWYELFPRSTAPDPSQHGSFSDVEALVPEIAAMGFDVLYFPPIHPIGDAFRKGPNNNVIAGKGDPGSPWAIGSKLGGHTAIHPELGTFDDFEHLVSTCRANHMELALDIAFQCSPDHPWVAEHPDWFIQRPDGTIQYAENPPKKYQDIYPLNFESPSWRALWQALHDVFSFWVHHGVTVFRVDNPHTKALPFWEWCLAELRKKHPEVIFLSEAFTRPHVMYALAKAGFAQSYTYFTWRNTSDELREYFEEITKPPVTDFFRPNLWPNTPDILHATLQNGGRTAFMQRVILSATLAANYGIYGPAYELGENLPAKPGSEEYLNSEKYQIRQWDRRASHSLAPLISQLNHIRRENPALQSDGSLHFYSTDNPHLLCYSKMAGENLILVVINLDAQEQAGWVDLDLKHLGIEQEAFEVEDLLSGAHYQWHGSRNYVALRPETMPAHIFRITRDAGNGNGTKLDSAPRPAETTE